MELKTNEQTVSYLQRGIPEPVFQELTAEAVVPESLPDLDRILGAWGTVIVQEKRVEEGTLRLSGGVQTSILYLSQEGDSPCQLEAWLPFLIRKPIDGETGCVFVRSWLKSIDARTVNARKALVRANLCFEISVFSPKQLTLISIADPPRQLQQKKSTYPAILPVACEELEFRVQDELPLPQTLPAVERILQWELHPVVTQSRMVGSKAVFQGEIAVFVLYLTQDGSVCSFTGALPYSQYAEMRGEWPDGEIQITPLITMAQLETDGQRESRTLLADLSLLAQVCVLNTIPLTLTEDAYAVGGTLEPSWQELNLQPQLDQRLLTETAKFCIPGKISGNVGISILPDRPTLRRNGEKLSISTAIGGTILYRDADGQLRGKPIKAEGSTVLDASEGCRCLAYCRVAGPVETTVTTEGLQVSVPLEFTLALYQESAWRSLCGGTIQPLPEKKRPSVILRHFSGGALWPLAKQLGAEVEAIQAANQMDDRSVPENEILLIPLS